MSVGEFLATGQSDDAVRLEGITKRFGKTTAANRISLKVMKGEFLTLLGPSGCGKTTLLNLIAGFLQADEGDVFIHGQCVTRTPVYRRSIGMVFQSYALFPHMSVAENVAFGLKMRKVPRSEVRRRVGATLEVVRLGNLADRRPKQLSGGQQQRVALARALVVNPEVLLLDEPLSALDKNLRTEMQIELKEIQRSVGITTVFVTHDQNEALSLSDRVAVMDAGVIQQMASPGDLYVHPSNSFVASFIGDINRIPGVVKRKSPEYCIHLPDNKQICLPVKNSAVAEAGENVVVFIRPERLNVGPLADQPVIASGTVQGHVYQGAFVDVHVACPAIGVLHARAFDRGVIERWPSGSTVEVSADLSEALIFRS